MSRRRRIVLRCPHCGATREARASNIRQAIKKGWYAGAEIDWEAGRGIARCGLCSNRANSEALLQPPIVLSCPDCGKVRELKASLLRGQIKQGRYRR